MLAGCSNELDRYRYSVVAQRFRTSDTVIVYYGDRMTTSGSFITLYSDAATVTIDTTIFSNVITTDRAAGR